MIKGPEMSKFKGPHKWTFLRHVYYTFFYQFLHADYEYNIFRMLKNIMMIF